MKYTSREDLNMSTPGMGACTMHGLTPKATPAPVYVQAPYQDIFTRVVSELLTAEIAFPPMVSAHEGFAILKEEVDELWDAVRMKQSDPDRPHAMRVEALQVAAMALRFLHDVCGDE